MPFGRWRPWPFCRGGFSQANAALLGSANSAKHQDSQQLEVPKPAHSELQHKEVGEYFPISTYHSIV